MVCQGVGGGGKEKWAENTHGVVAVLATHSHFVPFKMGFSSHLDKRGRHIVDLVLGRKLLQVLNVLGREHGDLHLSNRGGRETQFEP